MLRQNTTGYLITSLAEKEVILNSGDDPIPFYNTLKQFLDEPHAFESNITEILGPFIYDIIKTPNALKTENYGFLNAKNNVESASLLFKAKLVQVLFEKLKEYKKATGENELGEINLDWIENTVASLKPHSVVPASRFQLGCMSKNQNIGLSSIIIAFLLVYFGSRPKSSISRREYVSNYLDGTDKGEYDINDIMLTAVAALVLVPAIINVIGHNINNRFFQPTNKIDPSLDALLLGITKDIIQFKADKSIEGQSSLPRKLL